MKIMITGENVNVGEITECKYCCHYCCVVQSGTQFEHGKCSGWHDEIMFDVNPYDYCSKGECVFE